MLFGLYEKSDVHTFLVKKENSKNILFVGERLFTMGAKCKHTLIKLWIETTPAIQNDFKLKLHLK